MLHWFIMCVTNKAVDSVLKDSDISKLKRKHSCSEHPDALLKKQRANEPNLIENDVYDSDTNQETVSVTEEGKLEFESQKNQCANQPNVIPNDVNDFDNQKNVSLTDKGKIEFNKTSSWTDCQKCQQKNSFPQNKMDHCGYALMDSDGRKVVSHVVKVPASTPEFKEVASKIEMHNSKETGLKTLCVFRNQNKSVHDRFVATCENDRVRSLETNNFDYCPTEAFHTTSPACLETILAEGFDQRLAMRGNFGRGIYSSPNPLKSKIYWKGKGNVKSILKVRVALGRTKKIPKDHIQPSLLREPKGFDSVVGDIHNMKEFVVYDNSRVEIEYVITYIDTTTC